MLKNTVDQNLRLYPSGSGDLRCASAVCVCVCVREVAAVEVAIVGVATVGVATVGVATVGFVQLYYSSS